MTRAGVTLSAALERIVDRYLEADSLLARNLVATLQKCAHVLPSPVANWSPESVHTWWEKRDGLPPALEFLQIAMQAHHAPLLGSVSMCLSGPEPTLYVPVPWTAASVANLQEARACLWYNAPKRLVTVQTIDWATSLRSIAHAIANLSYAVRLGDSPARGWLAYAHECGRLIYLPDTQAIEGTTEVSGQLVHSVGTDEERYMGMASVIYMPLSSRDIPEAEVLGRPYSSVVLMVWSPIPHLWDESLDSTHVVQDVVMHKKYVAPLNGRFRLLGHDVVRRAAEAARAETDVLSTVTTLQARIKDGPPGLWPAWRRTMHDLQGLLDLEFVREAPSSVLASEWLADFFKGPNGACQTLASAFPDFLEVTLRAADLRTGRQATEHAAHIAEWSDLLLPMIERATLPFDVAAARLLCAEPVKNITDHCVSIDDLKIDVSQNYITIVLATTLKDESERQLFSRTGSRDSTADAVFRRYYGSRRGLPLWHSAAEHPEDLSLGMFLHGHVSRRFGVFHRLYVSPDASSSRVIIGMPFSANQ